MEQQLLHRADAQPLEPLRPFGTDPFQILNRRLKAYVRIPSLIREAKVSCLLMTIYLSAVTNMIDSYYFCFNICLINYPVVSNPDPEGMFCAPEFPGLRAERVVGKGFNRLNDLRDIMWIEFP
jgi:hypothetical protein